jgi:hypothetical protein
MAPSSDEGQTAIGQNRYRHKIDSRLRKMQQDAMDQNQSIFGRMLDWPPAQAHRIVIEFAPPQSAAAESTRISKTYHARQLSAMGIEFQNVQSFFVGNHVSHSVERSCPFLYPITRTGTASDIGHRALKHPLPQSSLPDN